MHALIAIAPAVRQHNLDVPCNTWSDPIRIDSYGGAYPSMVNLNDGSVLVTYYEEGSGSNIRARTINITGAPEPGSGILLAIGLVGTICFWWWRRAKLVLGGVS